MSDNFIGHIFEQNCGDSLKVLEKTNIKDSSNHHYLYRCQFQKYFYEILALKVDILKGRIKNPQIEQIEFIEKLWPQNCGDTLKIIKKSNQKQGNIALFECEFIKYPYRVLSTKSTILRGNCENPRIEEEEFINKLCPQHCGDDLRVIKRSNKKIGTNILYECEFIKYPYKILAQKGHIIRGKVENPNIPWVDKEENQVRNYIKSIYNGEIIKYFGKKEDSYKEIDIYLPELKKGIEYNGSIWHEEGNPNNPFSKPMGYHQNKIELFKKKGIDILFIWDYEWFKDYPNKTIVNEEIQQKIREFLQI